MDELLERIEMERNNADWHAAHGQPEIATIALSLADCDEIGRLLGAAYGPLLMGRREMELAENITLLANAFKGDGLAEDDDD